jgi:tRNA(fMet)-specific endonuclease VapC
MSVFVLDSDVLTLFQRGHQRVLDQILAHKPHDVVTTVVSLDEILSGWYTQARKAKTPDDQAIASVRFAQAWNAIRIFRAIAMDRPAIDRFRALLTLKLRVGRNDLRIAAIALEAGATLVTRNLRDFRRIPSLTCEDWSV